MSQNNELRINVMEILEILVGRKRFILGFSLFVSLVVAIYSLIVSPKYIAVAMLMPPTNTEGPSLKNIIKNTPLGKIGGLEAISKTMPNDPMNIYTAILTSRSIRMDLIREFDLIKVYEFDKRRKFLMEDVIKKVDKNFDYETGRDGTLAITMIDEDPKRAADMANYLVGQLDAIYKRLMNEKNHNYRVFLGERLEVVKADLEKAEKELLAFQKKHGMLDMESQAKATVAAGVNLDARYLAVRGNLEVARQVYSEDHPKVRELRLQLEQLEAQRRRLSGDKVSDFLLPYQQGPEIGLEYLRLSREQMIQQTIFELMVQQHEEAKFEESRNTPTVQVLDSAVTPERRFFPKRRKLVMIAFVLSFVFAIGVVLFAEGARRFRRARPEEAARIGRLLRQTWSFRKR